MSNYNKIKNEIIKNIDTKIKENSKLFKRIKKELELMASTEGINEQNNLESFYNIWQKNKNKQGNKNEINSWVAYALGMTSKKPSKEGDFLQKRRAFARSGFPDVDTDFDDINRDKVYEYIIKQYGRGNVGNIGAHGMLKFKSCITRVVKALDIADSWHKGKQEYITNNVIKVNEILAPFPKGGMVKVTDENGETQVIKDVDDAYKYVPDFRKYMDMYPEIYKHSKIIQGGFSDFSSHAAGIVISDTPIETIAPLRTTRKKTLATQYSGEQLEELGLIKFDILAISTLTVIKKTLELIRQNYDIKIDIEDIPLDDEDVFKLYRSGNLAGVFQCEQWGMQKTMVEIGVNSFSDIMAAIALYRPGPMKFISTYCARKNKEEEIDYFHNSIKEKVEHILKPTYGICIFQEQLMQICSQLADFSITNGYIMIKAVSKKKEYLMNKFKKDFIKGCGDNNVPQEIAEKYWKNFITPFASYGFNKSHSCCYAFNSYLTAYLKANYTEEFICSLLTVETNRGHYEKVERFEQDFKQNLDIKFLKRDINACGLEYKIESKKDKSKNKLKSEIRPNILCKGVGYKAAKDIVDKQPFDGLQDFAKRTDSSVVDLRTVEALLEGGYIRGNKGKKYKNKYIKKFDQYRKDLKAMKKKGVEPVDIFS
ncbi:MAG: hypothetical protein ACOCRK_02250 [bacterium]